jgi:ABC-type amino acid transport/signal transduction systems, periplasmic component/domain
MLPASLRQSGVLHLAGSADFPPDNFLEADQKTVTGYSYDMATAIAAKLGLKIDFTRIDFTGVLTGLQANRYDAGISFLDTAARRKVVDVVDFYKVSESFILRSNEPANMSPCGKKVGAGAGSTEAMLLPTVSKQWCTSQGKPGITVSVYPNNPQSVVALTSGRVDAVFSSTAPAAWTVKQASNSLKLDTQTYNPAGQLGGIAVNRNDHGLAQAMVAALAELIKDGTYQQILKKWNVSAIAITSASMNKGQG